MYTEGSVPMLHTRTEKTTRKKTATFSVRYNGSCSFPCTTSTGQILSFFFDIEAYLCIHVKEPLGGKPIQEAQTTNVQTQKGKNLGLLNLPPPHRFFSKQRVGKNNRWGEGDRFLWTESEGVQNNKQHNNNNRGSLYIYICISTQCPFVS